MYIKCRFVGRFVVQQTYILNFRNNKANCDISATVTLIASVDIIIIIAGYRPLQMFAISLDVRLRAFSSCQPSCANHHSTWPEDYTLHLSRRDLHSRNLLPQ
jgi:hypothetical protein